MPLGGVPLGGAPLTSAPLTSAPLGGVARAGIDPAEIGIVVGLEAEARIARTLGGPRGARVAVAGGHGSESLAAAQALVEGLVAAGARFLVSFGLAGGLDPGLAAGALVVPASVLVEGRRIPTDPGLSALLGGASALVILHAERAVTAAAEKARLHRETGAAAVDLESGAVARVAEAHGLPFAALRAICDPAGRTLPPAALVALGRDGRIRLGALAVSLLRQPGQMAGLVRLGADAAAARRALVERVRGVGAGG